MEPATIEELIHRINAAHARVLENQKQRSSGPFSEEGPPPPPTRAGTQPNAATSKTSSRSSPETASMRPPSQAKAADGFLTIEDVDQVRSGGVSPAASAGITPMFAGGSERDDTHTLPGVLSTTDGVQPWRGRASAEEVALYSAAEQLCVHLSGVDYRQVAKQATKACDIVQRMAKEELSLAKQSEWVPSYLVARQADRLRSLFQETKQLLVANGVAIPASLMRLTGSPAPPGATRPRNVSVDISATGGGRGVRRADGEEGSGSGLSPSREHLSPAAEEAYDVRLMHSAFDDRADPRTRELEDELSVLKTRLDKTQREKKDLLATVDRQEQQLAAMRSKLTKETEAFYHTQRQMQADLRQLAVTTGHRELLGSDDDALPSPTEQRRSPGAPVQQHHHRTQNLGEPEQDASSPGVSRPTSSSAGPRPISAGGDGSPSNVNSKYNRLDALYMDVYKGKGMEFLWQAVDVVFKLEYDVDSTPHRHGGGQATTSAAAPAAAGGDTARADHLMAAHARLKEDVHRSIVARLDEYDTFRTASAEVTPLRSEYVALCMQQRIKPNSGVVALLNTIAVDSDVVELDLAGNYIGDASIVPLLPLVRRMYRLQTLKLANNGLKNAAVRLLCQAVRQHPSLASLDLSNNNITRAAGRDLLGLVASLPKLKRIALSGTLIDAPLIEKIEKRLQLNREDAGGQVVCRTEAHEEQDE